MKLKARVSIGLHQSLIMKMSGKHKGGYKQYEGTAQKHTLSVTLNVLVALQGSILIIRS